MLVLSSYPFQLYSKYRRLVEAGWDEYERSMKGVSVEKDGVG